MAAFRASLTVTPEQIAAWPTYVLEDQSSVLGFYTLRKIDGDPYLDDLFVSPEAIGVGVGTALWEHMLGKASALGYSSFLIESDPYAEAFYLAKGAVRVGNVPSKLLEGRNLPLLRFTLP